jgi:hypothetical protein
MPPHPPSPFPPHHCPAGCLFFSFFFSQPLNSSYSDRDLTHLRPSSPLHRSSRAGIPSTKRHNRPSPPLSTVRAATASPLDLTFTPVLHLTSFLPRPPPPSAPAGHRLRPPSGLPMAALHPPLSGLPTAALHPPPSTSQPPTAVPTMAPPLVCKQTRCKGS